jgi:short chain dehydrogenase
MKLNGKKALVTGSSQGIGQALGELNILVNNAGVEKHGSFWEVTEADYDLVLNTNLKGAFFATQAFVRHRMQVKQPGKVINISSVHGALIFVNERTADYLGIPKDHPLRLGIDTGAAWDSHIPFLHPDDHEQTRRVWSTCLRTGSAGEVTFRVRNANARRLDQTCARAGTAV